MEKGTKYLLYFFILGCLVFPFIQKKKNLLTIAPLKASTETVEEPVFSFASLKSGAFQEQYTNYIDHNFGTRAFLIRLLNEIKFALFHQSDAPGVVVGKYNYLYLSSYTNNYLGLNFIGQNKIEENARKLKQIQDSLKKQNVDLIIVFAPGKASFYSEFLPDNLKSKKRDINNLSAYSIAFKNHQVNFIDLNSWFIALKKKARYALYPELGVHYTPHGTFLTSDTLVRYIEKLRKIDLPDVTKYTVYLSDSLREQEHDVEELMNLQYPLFHQPAPYFKLTVEKREKQVKPDLLGIGDSYWWQLTGLNLVSPFFKKDVYWYYNKSIYVDNTKQETPVNGLHYGDEILSRDVVVIMASEATYDLFPFEFIDKAYPIFCMSHSEKVNWLNEKVKLDAAWQESIKQKAKSNHISESEQQQNDIEYVINNDFTAYKAPQSYIDSVIHSYRNVILNNPNWLAGVKKKAAEKYIPIEWQLDLDAAYGYGMDYETEEAVQKLNQLKKDIRQSAEKLKRIEQNAKDNLLIFNEAMAWEIKRIFDEQRYKQ
jgi:SGNH hydrolase-like domain, acetyltransferase AlgX